LFEQKPQEKSLTLVQGILYCPTEHFTELEQSEQFDPLRQNPELQVKVQESLKVKTARPKVEFTGPLEQFKQTASDNEPDPQTERYFPAIHSSLEQSLHILPSL